MHTISRAYLEVNNDDDVYVRIVSFVMQSKARNYLLPNLIYFFPVKFFCQSLQG